MKRMKKVLSVFLSLVFVLSCCSAGVVGFAESEQENYDGLAKSFFLLSNDEIGTRTVTAGQASFTMPNLSIVGDTTRYTVTNTSDTYRYADSDGKPIRCLSYKHHVLAGDDATQTDNGLGAIANAYYYFDQIVSAQLKAAKRKNPKTVPLPEKMIPDMVNTLKNAKNDDGSYVFFDGYSYYVDSAGKILSRTQNPTYTVKEVDDKLVITYKTYDNNGNLVGTSANEKDQNIQASMGIGDITTSLTAANQVKKGTISVKTLWDLANVQTILGYFFAQSTAVNGGDFYHTYEFEIKTDVTYILENDNVEEVNVYDQKHSWSFGRTYDDTGLEASYYTIGVQDSSVPMAIDRTGHELNDFGSSMKAEFKMFFEDHTYSKAYEKVDKDGISMDHTNVTYKLIDNYFNSDLHRIWNNSSFTDCYDLFQAVSNKTLLNFYGDDAFSYINLITQLRPSDGGDQLPVRHSSKYGTDYRITDATCSSIISAVDELFTSGSIVKVISPLMPMLTANIDKESTIGQILGDLVINDTTGRNLNEIIQNVVPNILFQDKIVNLLMGFLYPMVSNMIDGLLTDQFFKDTFAGITDAVDLEGIIAGLVTGLNGSSPVGWQGLLYGILANVRVGLQPGSVAYCLDYYDYEDRYPRVFNALCAAGGGIKTTTGDIKESDLKKSTCDEWNRYKNAIVGCETKYGDPYCGHRWDGVNFDMLDGAWGINGSKAKFLDALSCALTPLAPLLACILGNQRLDIMVTDVAAIELSISLNYDDDQQNTLDAYAQLLLPILEALGVSKINDLPGVSWDNKLKSGNEFRSLASGIIGGTGNAQRITDFYSKGLLNPLLTWLLDYVLKNPLEAVADLLPNLVMFVDAGGVLQGIRHLEIPLVIRVNIKMLSWLIGDIHPKIPLFIPDLVKNIDWNMLGSLGGILKLINLSANTEDPVVGFIDPHDQASEPLVKAPNGLAWDSSNANPYTEPVKEAYVDPQYVTDGVLNSSAVTVDRFGKITRNVPLYKEGGNGRVKISGLSAYGDLQYENLIQGDQVAFSNGTNIVVTRDESQLDTFTTPVYRCYKYKTMNGVTQTTMYAFDTTNLTPEELATAELMYSINYIKQPIALPPIMDYKLMGCGNITAMSSLRDDNNTSTRRGMTDKCYVDYYKWDGTTYTFNLPGSGAENGGMTHWAPGIRLGVQLDDAGRGRVLIFLLRYILSALMYREYQTGGFADGKFISLLLKDSVMNKNIIGDLSVSTIVNNIALGPDAVICTLFELLTPKFPNETSDLSMYDIEQTLATGRVVQGHPEGSKTDYYKYSMSNVGYEYDALYKAATKYNDYYYGTETKYTDYWTREDSLYLTDNLDEVIGNIGAMIGPKGDNPGVGMDLSNGIGGLLNDLIGGYINDGIVDMIAGALYPLLDGLLNGALKGILDGALGADYSKQALINAFEYTFKRSDLPIIEKLQADLINHDENYTAATFAGVVWGVGDTDDDKELRGSMNKFDMLLKNLSALFSPFAVIFRFLFTGEDLTVLREVDDDGNIDFRTGLLCIPGYEGYQYAWVPLMRGLGCEDGLLSYRDYFARVYTPTDLSWSEDDGNGGTMTVSVPRLTASNVNTVELLLNPIICLAKNLLANPIKVLFGMIPNLMFYLTIGAFSDTINNLIQPVYVLLDMVSPIVDAIPVVNSLIANLDLKGVKLPLALPLDLDLNSLLNSVLGGLLGDLLGFDIRPKKNVIGKTLTPVTQDFVAMPAKLDALSGEPAVITEDSYTMLSGEDKLHYSKLYRIHRDANGNAAVDNDPASETYGQILYDEVVDTAMGSPTQGMAIYGRYDSNGVFYQNPGADYRDCYVKVEQKNTPVYEVNGFDSTGMPTYSQAYEKDAGVPMQDSDGNNYLQDAAFDPNTRTCWTNMSAYDYTRPIAGEKKQLEKESDYYAWGRLSISLPYLDLNTVAFGTMKFQATGGGYGVPWYVGINSDGGCDLITILVRLVIKVLALKQNSTNIVQFLDSTCLLDADDEDMLRQVLGWIISLLTEYNAIDMVLHVVMIAYKLVVPVSGKLAEKFKDPNCEYNVQSLLAAIKDGVSSGDLSIATNAISNIISSGPQKDPDYDSGAGEKLSIFAKIIQALKKFFENIKLFFQKLFGKA